MLDDFDAPGFWERSAYADEAYVDEPVTAEVVSTVERALGYRLPESYVALMKTQNGGIPKRTAHRTTTATSWAKDHVAMTGFFAIGRRKNHSVCGPHGNRFWTQEWGYPAIGIYFADCPSAGHDMMCLDYRACGPTGEPCVVHVDQELGYAITFVAPTFEIFVRGLQLPEAFDDEE